MLGAHAGFVWVDIGEWEGAAERVLTDIFRFNPMAIQDCAQRNQVPKVHVYADHVFVVLHAPEAGRAGHVHYIELDQFIGTDFLVTVHGPLNPAVDPEATRVEVDAVLQRLHNGRLHPAGIVFASLLMSLLYLGGESAQINLALPSAVTGLFQGTLLFFLLAADVFINYRVRFKRLTTRAVAA